jgi:hypothetical protein
MFVVEVNEWFLLVSYVCARNLRACTFGKQTSIHADGRTIKVRKNGASVWKYMHADGVRI